MPYFWGPYAIFSVEIPSFNRLLCHTDPHCMAYFGGIFFANMGGGGGQNYFQHWSPQVFPENKAPRDWSIRISLVALAAKRPNSDLKFAGEFFGRFFAPAFFQRKKAHKKPPKYPLQNSHGNLFGKIPLGFLQKPFLD